MSRVERLLKAIIQNGSYDEERLSRVEGILYAFLKDHEYTKDPESRMEALLIFLKEKKLYDDVTLSRVEDILKAKIDGVEYTKEPESRVEELLIMWDAIREYDRYISGTLPLHLTDSIGADLVDWSIVGNTYQERTPTPTPQMSPNLAINSNGAYMPLYLPVGTKVMVSASRNVRIRYYRASESWIDWWDLIRNKNGRYYADVFDIRAEDCYYFGSDGVYNDLNLQVVISTDNLDNDIKYTPYGEIPGTGPCEVKGVGDRTGNLADVIYGKVPTISTGALIPFDGVTTEYISTKAKTDTFRLSFVKPNGSNTFSVFFYSGDTLVTTKDLNTSQTITRYGVSDTVDRIRIRIDLADNTISNIMLNSGSTPLPYEPYGVKIPVVSRGKNLCPPLKNGISISFVGGVESQSANSSASDFIPFRFDNDSTRVSFTGMLESGSDTANCVFAYDDKMNFIGRTGNGASKERNLDKSSFGSGSGTKEYENIRFLRISVSNGTFSGNVMMYKYQYNGTADYPPYEPYRQPIISTQYLPTPLMANERLTPTAREVKWGVKAFNGSEYWVQKSPRFYSNTIDAFAKTLVRCYCSHYIYDYGKGAYIGSGSSRFSISDANYSSVTDFKAWLKSEYDAGHPVTVWYQLATPTTEPVETTPIGTLDGECWIDVDTEVKPVSMSATYKSSKPDNAMQLLMELFKEV